MSLNLEQARKILGVSQTASIDDLKIAYQEKSSGRGVLGGNTEEMGRAFQMLLAQAQRVDILTGFEKLLSAVCQSGNHRYRTAFYSFYTTTKASLLEETLSISNAYALKALVMELSEEVINFDNARRETIKKFTAALERQKKTEPFPALSLSEELKKQALMLAEFANTENTVDEKDPSNTDEEIVETLEDFFKALAKVGSPAYATFLTKKRDQLEALLKDPQTRLYSKLKLKEALQRASNLEQGATKALVQTLDRSRLNLSFNPGEGADESLASFLSALAKAQEFNKDKLANTWSVLVSHLGGSTWLTEKLLPDSKKLCAFLNTLTQGEESEEQKLLKMQVFLNRIHFWDNTYVHSRQDLIHFATQLSPENHKLFFTQVLSLFKFSAYCPEAHKEANKSLGDTYCLLLEQQKQEINAAFNQQLAKHKRLIQVLGQNAKAARLPKKVIDSHKEFHEALSAIQKKLIHDLDKHQIPLYQAQDLKNSTLELASQVLHNKPPEVRKFKKDTAHLCKAWDWRILLGVLAGAALGCLIGVALLGAGCVLGAVIGAFVGGSVAGTLAGAKVGLWQFEKSDPVRQLSAKAPAVAEEIPASLHFTLEI